MHGKIYPIGFIVTDGPPVHLFCKCKIVPMKTVVAGNATQDGVDGADYWIKHYKKLPMRYITKKEARQQKWKANKGNLAEVLPGKVIGGDRYYNDDGHLPEVSGREWYEADIDYVVGFRGNSRLLYSNDGLMFVTYDHYRTYVEVI